MSRMLKGRRARSAPGRPASRQRHPGDRLFQAAVHAAAWLPIAVLGATVVFLLVQAWPALAHYGPFSSLGSTGWAPSRATTDSTSPNPYGLVQFIYGSMLTALIGMAIAVPASIAVALYLTEVAPRVIRRPLAHLVDLLAAIPSVVYGFWAIFALAPALRPVGETLTRTLGAVPVIGALFARPFYGYSYLTAG